MSELINENEKIEENTISFENDAQLISVKELASIFSFHTFLFGKSGSGKTFLASKGFQAMPHTSIFFNTLGLHEIQGTEVKNVQELDKLLKQDMFNNVNLKIKISKKMTEDIEDYAQRIYPLIKRIQKYQNIKYQKGTNRPLFLFFDEVQLFNMLEDAKLSKKFRALIKSIALTGRNYKMFGVFISQRAAIIDKSIMTQCNSLIGFLENYDVKYFHDLHIELPEIEEKSNKFYYLNQDKIIKLDTNKV